MISRIGTALDFWADTQGTSKIVTIKYASILWRYALNKNAAFVLISHMRGQAKNV